MIWACRDREKGYPMPFEVRKNFPRMFCNRILVSERRIPLAKNRILWAPKPDTDRIPLKLREIQNRIPVSGSIRRVSGKVSGIFKASQLFGIRSIRHVFCAKARKQCLSSFPRRAATYAL